MTGILGAVTNCDGDALAEKIAFLEVHSGDCSDMNTVSVEKKLRMTLDTALQQLRGLSGILEFGQSATPLAHYFSALENFSSSDELSAIVLGTCPHSSVKLVEWLTGLKAPVFHLVLSDKRIALIQLSLRGSGYGLDDLNGQSSEFSDAESFLSSLEDFTANQCDSSCPPGILSIRVPGHARSEISRIYVVGDPDTVRANAPIFQTLVSNANLTIVGAPSDFTFSGTVSDFMEELSVTTDVVLPAVLAAEEQGGLPAQGWWSSDTLVGPFRLLPLVLVEDSSMDEASFADSLPGQPLTHALRFRLVAAKLNFGAAALASRLDDEIKLTDRRRGALEEKSRTIQSFGKIDLKPSQDSLRIAVDNEIQRLILEVDARNRIVFEPYGNLATDIMTVIEGLTDLDREVSSVKTVRLDVPQEFSAYLKKLIEERVRTTLSQDVAFLNMALRVLFTKLNEQLNVLIQRNPGIQFSVEDEDRIADGLRTLIVIEIRSRGELPRANLMRFLSSARQMAFMLIITLQLVFGGLFLGQSGGGSLRQILAPFMFIMLLGGVIYSIISFRKDRQELIDKELTRVKESLSADSRRVLNDIQRDKLSRLTAALNNIQKRTVRAVDELLKEHSAGRVASSEREALGLQAQMRHLTQRLRKLQDAQKAFGQVQGNCDTFQALTRDFLDESVRMSANSEHGNSVTSEDKEKSPSRDTSGQTSAVSSGKASESPDDVVAQNFADSKSSSDWSETSPRITLRQRLANATKREK